MLTVISFFTRDWQYPEYAENLKQDCARLGLPYDIQELPSTGSYLKNTCMKPEFILRKLLEHASPVLWIDCDGSLLKDPIFFEDLKVDFAAKKMAEWRSRTWHVGTMWFNYTPAMITFLKRWIYNTGRISDESALERTWQQEEQKPINECILTSDIPDNYFSILAKGAKPQKSDVICHRISTGFSKMREEPLARAMVKKGIL